MRDFASGQVKKGARSIGFGATVTLDYGSLLHKR